MRMAGSLIASHKTEIQTQAERVSAFVREGRDEAFAVAGTGT